MHVMSTLCSNSTPVVGSEGRSLAFGFPFFFPPKLLLLFLSVIT